MLTQNVLPNSRHQPSKLQDCFLDFMLSKRGQEIVRDMNRIPDRVDVKPKQPRLMEGIEPVFAPAEVLENFEQYAKRFQEIFGGG